MLDLEILIFELGTVDGLSAGSVALGEVTTLNGGMGLRVGSLRVVGGLPSINTDQRYGMAKIGEQNDR